MPFTSMAVNKTSPPSSPPGSLSRLHLGDAGSRGPADPPRHPHHPLSQHAQQGGPAADHPCGGAVAARSLHNHGYRWRRHGSHHSAAHRQRWALRGVRLVSITDFSSLCFPLLSPISHIIFYCHTHHCHFTVLSVAVSLTVMQTQCHLQRALGLCGVQCVSQGRRCVCV